MSGKKSKEPKVAKNQLSITSLFSKLTVSETSIDEKAYEKVTEPTTILKSEDADVNSFYASLTPGERVAHEIAVEKLGTSYDVVRTHGFQRWRSARK